MLVWKSTTDEKRRTLVRGEARIGADAEVLGVALADLWEKVLDELDARTDEGHWDILICQLVTQCGSLAVYPARESTGEQHDASFTVYMTVDSWDAAYHSLPQPENEPRFVKAYDRLHEKQRAAVKKAIQDPRVRSRFAALKRRPTFAVFAVDEGETSVRDRMVFLWGNRPPKRAFATAQELFEHVFRKAELFPQNSMRLRDQKVVAVNWFGHAFTDRFVDWLEQVPNISSLCADLEEFMLTATRIPQSGVERLKKLLPNTRFTIVTDEEFERGIDPWR